ncbi:MAG: polymer-forming cytoskeletal protein [Ignavibacteriaceae bacterium]|nr:polymer-forming cytoskeletal protein [Ignavibacteriaceae bacterium]
MKTKTMDGDSEDITIISNGVKVEGKVSSNGSIRLDGIIQGDILCQGNITIGESGEVYGKVNGQSITIGGKVEGIVNAKEKLILEAKADLKGDVFTKILVVEAGARFDGKSNMAGSGDNTISQSSNP